MVRKHYFGFNEGTNKHGALSEPMPFSFDYLLQTDFGKIQVFYIVFTEMFVYLTIQCNLGKQSF